MSSPDVATEATVAAPEMASRAASPRVHPDWSDRAEALSFWTRTKLALVRTLLVGWMSCFGLTGLYRFGAFFAFFEYLFAAKRRRRVHAVLDRLLPNEVTGAQRRQIMRRYFRRTRCDKMLYTIMDRLPREALLKRLHFPRRETLDRILSGGRGVYIAMSHFGSHHVAALIMTLLGYKVAGVRDRNEGALRRYIQQKFAESLPEFATYRMFFADAFPREIYRCFDHNFVVASAQDVDVDRVRDGRLRTRPVRLFGEERHFLSGPMQMAIRRGAPIMQGFVISRRDYHYEFVLEGPLADPGAITDPDELLAVAMQRYADGIESHVRAYPCHLMKI